MTKLQSIYQLKMLMRDIENKDRENPKVEALRIAINTIRKSIASEQPCCFDNGNECVALIKKSCFLCKFCKTKDEYIKSQEKSNLRLRLLKLSDLKNE